MNGNVVLLGCARESEGVILPDRNLRATQEDVLGKVSANKKEMEQISGITCPAIVLVFSFLIWISQTLLGCWMTLET